MTALTLSTMASMAGAGGSHVTHENRMFIAGAFVLALVVGIGFIWWVRSERDDD